MGVNFHSEFPNAVIKPAVEAIENIPHLFDVLEELAQHAAAWGLGDLYEVVKEQNENAYTAMSGVGAMLEAFQNAANADVNAAKGLDSNSDLQRVDIDCDTSKWQREISCTVASDKNVDDKAIVEDYQKLTGVLNSEVTDVFSNMASAVQKFDDLNPVEQEAYDAAVKVQAQYNEFINAVQKVKAHYEGNAAVMAFVTQNASTLAGTDNLQLGDVKDVNKEAPDANDMFM